MFLFNKRVEYFTDANDKRNKKKRGRTGTRRVKGVGGCRREEKGGDISRKKKKKRLIIEV